MMAMTPEERKKLIDGILASPDGAKLPADLQAKLSTVNDETLQSSYAAYVGGGQTPVTPGIPAADAFTGPNPVNDAQAQAQARLNQQLQANTIDEPTWRQASRWVQNQENGQLLVARGPAALPQIIDQQVQTFKNGVTYQGIDPQKALAQHDKAVKSNFDAAYNERWLLPLADIANGATGASDEEQIAATQVFKQLNTPAQKAKAYQDFRAFSDSEAGIKTPDGQTATSPGQIEAWELNAAPTEFLYGQTQDTLQRLYPGANVQGITGITQGVQSAIVPWLRAANMAKDAAAQMGNILSSYEKSLQSALNQGVLGTRAGIYAQMLRTIQQTHTGLLSGFGQSVAHGTATTVADYLNQNLAPQLSGLLIGTEAAPLAGVEDMTQLLQGVQAYKFQDEAKNEAFQAGLDKVVADRKTATDKTNAVATAKTAKLEAIAANPIVNGAPRYSYRQVAAAKAELAAASGGSATGPSVADEYNTPQGHIPQVVQTLHQGLQDNGQNAGTLEDFYNQVQKNTSPTKTLTDAAYMTANNLHNQGDFTTPVVLSNTGKMPGDFGDYAAPGYSYSDYAGQVHFGRRQLMPVAPGVVASTPLTAAQNAANAQQLSLPGTPANPIGGPAPAATPAPAAAPASTSPAYAVPSAAEILAS